MATFQPVTLLTLITLMLNSAGSWASEDRNGPWGMTYLNDLKDVTHAVPMILEGRGPTKAAFTVFATGAEIRAPEETVRMLENLRDLDQLPIHGLWIETQHIRFSPSEVQSLVGLARRSRFYTMIRVPTEERADIQGYIATGADGIVIPVVERVEQIRDAISNTFYSAWREIGFEPDTGNLRKLADAQLASIDYAKSLAFMIESVKGVERIAELVTEAAKLCDSYGINRRHVIFWMGPYDAKVNRRRLMKESATKAEEWWKATIIEVAKAVNQAGFSMGGHMATIGTGLNLLQQAGFRIFTIPGIADSFGNPRVPSTGGLFLGASDLERRSFLQEPALNAEELERLRQLQLRLAR